MDTMSMATSAELKRMTRAENSGPVVPPMPLVAMLVSSVIGLFLWMGIILGVLAIF